MKPFCIRCGEISPDPIRDPEGDLIYWFKIETREDGSPVLYGEVPPEGGERQIDLTGMTEKDFEYDGSFDVVCPQCTMEECPYIKDESRADDDDEILDDDGWINEEYDPFDEDYEDFLD